MRRGCAALTSQVRNPVASLPVDDDGVVLTLPERLLGGRTFGIRLPRARYRHRVDDSPSSGVVTYGASRLRSSRQPSTAPVWSFSILGRMASFAPRHRDSGRASTLVCPTVDARPCLPRLRGHPVRRAARSPSRSQTTTPSAPLRTTYSPTLARLSQACSTGGSPSSLGETSISASTAPRPFSVRALLGLLIHWCSCGREEGGPVMAPAELIVPQIGRFQGLSFGFDTVYS